MLAVVLAARQGCGVQWAAGYKFEIAQFIIKSIDRPVGPVVSTAALHPAECCFAFDIELLLVIHTLFFSFKDITKWKKILQLF